MQLEFVDEGKSGSVCLMAEFPLAATVLSATPKQNLLWRAAHFFGHPLLEPFLQSNRLLYTPLSVFGSGVMVQP